MQQWRRGPGVFIALWCLWYLWGATSRRVRVVEAASSPCAQRSEPHSSAGRGQPGGVAFVLQGALHSCCPRCQSTARCAVRPAESSLGSLAAVPAAAQPCLCSPQTNGHRSQHGHGVPPRDTGSLHSPGAHESASRSPASTPQLTCSKPGGTSIRSTCSSTYLFPLSIDHGYRQTATRAGASPARH